MFDSLADRIREDDQKEISPRERYLRWTAVAVLSILLFAALYLGVHMLE